MPEIAIVAIMKDEEFAVRSFFQQFETVTTDWNVLVDRRTSDRTAAFASQIGAKVAFGEFQDFAQFRNQALMEFVCDQDYVIMLDADERISHDTLLELQKVRDGSFKHPDVECWLSPLRALYPNGNSGWFHPKEWLFKNGSNMNFVFKAHEKIMAYNKACFTRGAINHHLILHDWERRDGANEGYNKLMLDEPYYTDPAYKREMDSKFPFLFYGKNDDPRIQKYSEL